MIKKTSINTTCICKVCGNEYKRKLYEEEISILLNDFLKKVNKNEEIGFATESIAFIVSNYIKSIKINK